MASAQAVNLSTNDLHILNSVFDPESGPSCSITIDATLPEDPTLPSSLLASLRASELSAIRAIESVPPHASPPEKHAAYTRAHAQLTAAIAAAPAYASARNNRAQLERWRFGDTLSRDGAEAAETAAALMRALADLDAAIAAAAPPAAAAEQAVSPARARVLGSAWAQRGAVLFGVARGLAREGMERVDEDVVDAVRAVGEGEVPEWVGWERPRLEDEASRCFFVAGLYGCELGRAMAVVSNPYARLCGAIVKEAIRGEIMG